MGLADIANASRKAQSFKQPLGKSKVKETKSKTPAKKERSAAKSSSLTVAEQQKLRRQRSALLTIEVSKAQKEELMLRAEEEGITLKALVLEALRLS